MSLGTLVLNLLDHKVGFFFPVLVGLGGFGNSELSFGVCLSVDCCDNVKLVTLGWWICCF